jgi:DNA-binding MarR family transcriptional regulator
MKKRSKPASTPFDAMLGYHLRRASVIAMADLTQALAPLGLTPTTASILFIIGANAGLNQSEIGRTLGLLRANMVPLMASLFKRGLVLRTQVDGRSQALRLSAAGENLTQRAWDAANGHEARMFGALTPRQRERMIEQLRGVWSSRA